MKEIVITVAADGSTQVEVFGVTGKKCVDLSEPFEQILGAAGKRKMKAEAHAAEKAGQKVKARR